MLPEKDKILCTKYPLIFKNRDGSIMDTCMAWGFECEDGWFDLLDTLCGKIQRYVDWKSKNLCEEEKESLQVIASQVKEKFGTLRFYYYGGDDTIRGMVDMAEALSDKICEECGNRGNLNKKGWYKTLCDNCRISNYEVGEVAKCI